MKKYTDDVLSLPLQFRKDWARALRSGKMQQTDGILYDGEEGYCCLGVAGIVRGIDPNRMKGSAILRSKSYGFRKDDSQFNPELINGTNIKYAKTVAPEEIDDFDEDPDPINRTASECNDDLGLSFSQIADLIYRE